MKTLNELKSQESRFKQILTENNNLPNKSLVLKSMKVLEQQLLGWERNVQVQDEVNNLLTAIDKLRSRIK